MMTKRDYEKAAEIVRKRILPARDYELIVSSFVQLFANDNPRFDATRFRKACEP